MTHKPYILLDFGPDGRPQVFSHPDDLIVAWEPDEVAQAFEQMQAAKDAGKWLAGFASYELSYALEPKLAARIPKDRRSPLICFGVFDGPNEDATTAKLAQIEAEQDRAKLSAPTPVWDEPTYTKAFDQVAQYIASGDFYQTNLTFPMRATWSGTAEGLFGALSRVQAVNYGGIVDLGQGPVLVSRSPELFYRTNAKGVISTRPMKGTVPRGKTEAEDAELKAFLGSDEKNRAENLMIVDLLRNDISRVAELGSVKVPELFTVESYATVHQMTSLVQAQMRAEVSIAEMFTALFPCGSITGAPKIRAMEVINDLEEEARDIYCGSIGWIGPDGSSAFNVAIRTLSLDADGTARLNVGGGVVYDSTAPSEYEEALWKARYATLLPQTW
ncbi:aminodeoxychorismate synthase component I [Amylibacter sp. IMCC11727]|uniref:aminodeoxychorismate synthase component I n=1 Tax=Amylibacter sp. IMCC11727 TaxID=3039851 RepID=UPI00244DD664|nr:aminodeoxychorismate synthase component I [Amylibacter sp. IMCC11727]WGI22950.1 aminodeoxychorismate synthase component I [Amylibacter sp. IMCC11727]